MVLTSHGSSRGGRKNFWVRKARPWKRKTLTFTWHAELRKVFGEKSTLISLQLRLPLFSVSCSFLVTRNWFSTSWHWDFILTLTCFNNSGFISHLGTRFHRSMLCAFPPSAKSNVTRRNEKTFSSLHGRQRLKILFLSNETYLELLVWYQKKNVLLQC